MKLRGLAFYCAVSIALVAAPASAGLLAYESFDYADVSADLYDKDGGEGFFGEWLQYNGAPVVDNWRIAEGSLTYRGLQTAGNSVTSDMLTGADWVGLTRLLDSEHFADETTTKYLSFLMRPEGDVGAGAYGGAFGVIIEGTGGGGHVLIGKTEGPPDYMLETFFNTQAHYSGTSVESEETSLVVVKAELRDGADVFTMYLNPTPGQPEPAAGTIKRDLDVGAVTSIAIAAAGAVSVDELRWGDAFADVTPVAAGITPLQAGDADMDLDFDQVDLVRVQVAAKYLTVRPATWGEGDWNGGPGGQPGSPPAGNERFDQLDVIAALAAGVYLTGPYAAVTPGGSRGDEQTTIVYDASTGELAVDAPASTELTSINIDSVAAIFTGELAQNLGGSFDNDADGNIFKATFGSSFGSLSFGNATQTGLSEEFVLADLTVIGSLAGGGDLGSVDLIYVPEPSAMILLSLGSVVLAGLCRLA